MMAYAKFYCQNLLAPAVWECRQLNSHRIAMIADFVPGNPQLQYPSRHLSDFHN